MPEHRLISDFVIPLPLERVFAFFADAANLERITPPWLNFSILTSVPITLERGALIDYRIRLRGIPIRWRTRIAEWNPPHSFVDEQLKGPYALWHHTHEFFPVPDELGGGTRMIDTVRYRIPFGPLGEIARRLFVTRDLERIFAYRRDNLASLLGVSPRPSVGPSPSKVRPAEGPRTPPILLVAQAR
jgi:ligand-binding SRPBCC domain-containing protein